MLVDVWHLTVSLAPHNLVFNLFRHLKENGEEACNINKLRQQVPAKTLGIELDKSHAFLIFINLHFNRVALRHAVTQLLLEPLGKRALGYRPVAGDLCIIVRNDSHRITDNKKLRQRAGQHVETINRVLGVDLTNVTSKLLRIT